MTINRENIRAKIAEYTTLGRRGTVDSGSTSTIVDSTIGAYSFDIPEGSIVYITTDAGGEGAAPEEEFAYVTDFNKTTGAITFSPAMTAAPAAGDTYELWEPCVEQVARVNEAISRALRRRCFYVKLVPLGMLADGDCQAVTGWTANASATRAVAALSFPFRFARYYLEVTSSDGADYVYQNVQAMESRSWCIAVLVRTAAATTGSVVLHDNAKNAVITPNGDTLSVTGETSAGSEWELLKATFEVPADCDNFAVRLCNDTAEGVTHFGFVALWPQDARSLPLPADTLDLDNVWRVFRLHEKLDRDFPYSWTPQPYLYARPVQRAYGELAIEFDTRLGSMGPLLAEIKTHYAALTDDDAGDTTSDTGCPDDYVSYMASLELAGSIAMRQSLRDGTKAAEPYRELEMRMLYEAGRVEREVVGRPPTIVRSWRG